MQKRRQNPSFDVGSGNCRSRSATTMVESEASGKGGEIRALLQQKAVAGPWSGMPVAEDEEPAVGVSIILERKLDAGKPHVRFDERGYGNVAMVEIETPTKGESRR